MNRVIRTLDVVAIENVSSQLVFAGDDGNGCFGTALLPLLASTSPRQTFTSEPLRNNLTSWAPLPVEYS